MQINNKYYLAEVCSYYDGAWDYYIKSDDIFNKYKIWAPITNKDEENIFISI